MALPSRIAFEPADQDDPTLSVDGLGDLLPERGDGSDPTLAVSALDDFFEPRPAAPITRAAKEPRPIIADAALEATERGIDVGRVEAPKLVAGSDPIPVQETFAPKPVVLITRGVEEPRPLVCRTEENAKSGRPATIDAGDRKLPVDIQRSAVEFQRLADKFHAFAAALAIPQPN